MHVLTYLGKPIAAAERLERLSEYMAYYTAAQQSDMAITSVEVLT
jgi:hypothetical protein